MAKRREVRITRAEDVAAVVQALTEGRSYGDLIAEHGDISKSRGAWHGWRTGQRVPTLANLLVITEALGAELVVRLPEGMPDQNNRAPGAEDGDGDQ